MRVNDLVELTSRCIHCGLCLESCPTFVLTLDETQSPRGRIHLVNAVLEGKLEWGSEVEQPLATCLGCRACETACPSGVAYGSIIELAREQLNQKVSSAFKRQMADSVTSARALGFQLGIAKIWPGKKVPFFVSLALSGHTAEAEIPHPQKTFDWPELTEDELPEVKGEVYMLEGCVMDVLFERVNEATRRLLRRAGYRVLPSAGGCCGAMHSHMGFLDEANQKSNELAKTYPQDIPIVVNAAGCGSAMKEGELASRTVDLSEFLVHVGFEAYLQKHSEFEGMGAYHDACHLAHGQGVREQPRTLLRAINGAKWVDLDESDMCCGSAGIYNVTQPKMARLLLDRKWQNISLSGSDFVVLSNPGCQAWIAQASRENGDRIPIYHIAEILEASLSRVTLD